MTETKFKKLVVAITAGAVILLIFLVSIMVYQLISIKVERDALNELTATIQEYKELIVEGNDTLEARKTYSFIENAARKLGYYFDGDKIYKI